jgi:hypothetical protein
MDEIEVDEYGFVWLGGLKIFRLTSWGLLEFYDRDRIRCDKRGSKFVYATPEQIAGILRLVEKMKR